jgi:hypothetical protein
MYVTPGGAVRVTKRRANVQANEVAFDVTIEIPNSVFREPNRRISIAVPEPEDRTVHVEATAVEVWADEGGRVHIAADPDAE